jgi:hypothetical protein
MYILYLYIYRLREEERGAGLFKRAVLPHCGKKKKKKRKKNKKEYSCAS